MVLTNDPGRGEADSTLMFSLSSLQLESCGCAILTPPWVHPERTLSTHVLLLGLRGSVPLREGEDAFELVPQRIAILRAGTVHAGRAPIQGPARYLWAHFSAPTTAEPTDAVLAPRWADLPAGSSVARLFHDLLAEAEAEFNWRVRVRFLDLLMGVSELVSPLRTEKVRPGRVVFRMKSLIAEGMSDPNLSLKSMAAREGLNPDYVSRQFKSQMGISVGDYLARMRVERAITMLETTTLPVLRVAEECGFATDRRFFRQFKRLVGKAPGEYRKSRTVIHMNVR